MELKKTKKPSKKRATKFNKHFEKKWLEQCRKSLYYSNDGMQPSVFGPVIWHFLHLMSFNYPVKPTLQDQEHYIDFVFSLSNVLPCRSCREHMKENLNNFGFVKNTDKIRKIMATRTSFARFIFDFHNKVNSQLRKSTYPDFNKVRKQYEMYRSRKRNEAEKHYHISLKAKILCEPKKS